MGAGRKAPPGTFREPTVRLLSKLGCICLMLWLPAHHACGQDDIAVSLPDWETVVGTSPQFHALMALRARAREDRVVSEAAVWEPVLAEGIAQARGSPQRELVVLALVAHGRVLWRLKRSADAERALRESIALARQLNRTDLLSDPMLVLGVILYGQGRLDELLTLYHELLVVAADDPRRRANALQNIGLVENRLGHMDAAVKALERAVELRRGVRNDLPELLPSAIQTLANLHADRGEHLRALQLAQEALDLRTQIGGAGLAAAELSMARSYARASDYTRAVQHWELGLAALDIKTSPAIRANAHCEYVDALHAAGRREAVPAALRLAEQLAQDLAASQSECQLTRARIALREQHPRQAWKLAHSLRLAAQAGADVSTQLSAAIIEAEGLLGLDQGQQALALIDTSLALAERASRGRERVPLLGLRAQALYATGQPKEAYEARLLYEQSDAQRRGASMTEQLIGFLQERESARAESEMQQRKLAEEAVLRARDRSLALAAITLLTLALALVLWARARESARRQRELQDKHVALGAAHVALEQHSAELLHVANTDALTGLPNRGAILRLLAKALADPNGQVVVVLFDLDHFKQINDQHGHASGDCALRHAAQIFAASAAPAGTVGRYGGEEFLLVLPDCPLPQARELAQRCLDRLFAQPLQTGTLTLTLSASAGISARTAGAGTDELLAQADAALYRAKAAGRNRLALASVAADESIVRC